MIFFIMFITKALSCLFESQTQCSRFFSYFCFFVDSLISDSIHEKDPTDSRLHCTLSDFNSLEDFSFSGLWKSLGPLFYFIRETTIVLMKVCFSSITVY